ncbi:MAG: hypothetical protein HY000_21470 [Planctomycetes bacterium]|nr:hypothetical protein [Planctomycetota bacterium]
MPLTSSGFKITRRRFSFWLGLGIFSVGEKLQARGFDELAATIMRGAEPAASSSTRPEHWRLADNQTWRWYERETLIDGQWTVTGITTPINKATGQPYTGRIGYLDESLVPEQWRQGAQPDDKEVAEDSGQAGPPRPDPVRRARHGRPPSKWLRSLHAEEIRIWLKTIDVPEAGVSGMTYWTHLTRDHSFDPEKIAGLTEDEQAKLHAAAHHGY